MSAESISTRWTSRLYLNMSMADVNTARATAARLSARAGREL